MSLLERVTTYLLGPEIGKTVGNVSRAFSGQHRPGAKLLAPRGQRNFDAAKTSELEHSWGTTPLSISEVQRSQLNTVKARSRHAGLNSDYARSYFGNTVAGVLGELGMRLRPSALNDDATKDKPATLDKPANEAISAWWKEWCRKGNCEVTGQHSFRGVQALVLRAVLEDGEAIIRHRWNQSEFGYQLQLLDSTLLDPQLWATLENGNKVKLGIEFNEDEAPVAYYFKAGADERARGNTYIQNIGRGYVRVPADEIIHLFLPERVTQKRGVPAMASALWRMRMLGKYEDAAVVKAVVGAGSAGILVSPAGEGYEGDDENEDGNLLHDLEYGEWLQVPHGTELKAWDPKYPDGQLPDFRKAMIQAMAAGLTTAYPTLSADLEGVSFSSIRQGVLAERLIHRAFQVWFAEHFLDLVYRQALQVALLKGSIQVPAKGGGTSPLPALKERKFQAVEWQGYRGEWVNPLQDIMAHVTAMDKRVTTPQEVIRKMGRDPQDVQQEWEEWLAWEKKVGFAPGDAGDRTLVSTALGAELARDANE